MSRSFLILIFLFLANAGLKAQQDPYFSTYLVNPSLINSSLSSTYDNNNVVLVYRNQWANYNPTNLSSSSGGIDLDFAPFKKSTSFLIGDFNNISDDIDEIELSSKLILGAQPK